MENLFVQVPYPGAGISLAWTTANMEKCKFLLFNILQVKYLFLQWNGSMWLNGPQLIDLHPLLKHLDKKATSGQADPPVRSPPHLAFRSDTLELEALGTDFQDVAYFI